MKAGTLSWQDYSNRLDDSQKWIAKWGQETEGQIRTQEDLVKANQQARASAIAHNAALKQQTIGAKATTVALKALSMAGNMLIMWAITKAIELVVKGIDNLIHKAENAQKRIDELSDSLEEGKSKFESLSNELESVNNQIDEILSKGKIEFTDQEELENLKQQRLELERQLAIQEELNKQKATELSNEIWEDRDTLNKNFDKDLGRLKDFEDYKQDLLKLVSEGFISQEDYENEIEIAEKKFDSLYSNILEDIQNFENNRSALMNKYNGDISKMSITDKALLDDINERLNNAYKEIYSKSEYNRLIIKPVFETEGLENLQQKITDYFINNGSLDVDALEEKFGTDIIDALRISCEKAGIEFDQFLEDLYNQSKMTSYGLYLFLIRQKNAPKAKKYLCIFVNSIVNIINYLNILITNSSFLYDYISLGTI